MQVDCYKRNFHTEVCSLKCPFRNECEIHYSKEVINRDREILHSSIRNHITVNTSDV